MSDRTFATTLAIGVVALFVILLMSAPPAVCPAGTVRVADRSYGFLSSFAFERCMRPVAQ